MQPVFQRTWTVITTIFLTILALGSTAGAAEVTVRAGSFANISEPGAVVVVEIRCENEQQVSEEISKLLKANPLFKLSSRAEAADSKERNAQIYRARMDNAKANMSGRRARNRRDARASYVRCEYVTFKKR